jgi:hypothetical protein
MSQFETKITKGINGIPKRYNVSHGGYTKGMAAASAILGKGVGFSSTTTLPAGTKEARNMLQGFLSGARRYAENHGSALSVIQRKTGNVMLVFIAFKSDLDAPPEEGIKSAQNFLNCS